MTAASAQVLRFAQDDNVKSQEDKVEKDDNVKQIVNLITGS